MAFSASPSSPAALNQLRRKIGWLCQFVRFAALAYALWTLYAITTMWLSKTQVAGHYGNWLRADLSGITDWQRLGGYFVHFAVWLLAAACVYSAWRLFSGFLAGRIFTADAAIWMRRAGMFGLAAQIADMFTRPIVTALVSMHLPTGSRMTGISFNQNDLVFLMLLTALVALAHVFKTAAEIAEENEGII